MKAIAKTTVQGEMVTDIREDFFSMLACTGDITVSLNHAGITAQVHSQWMQTDDWYRKKVLNTKESYRKDMQVGLVKEAWERAVVGWEEPVYQNGEKVGTKRKKSDALLCLLLKRLPGFADPSVVQGVDRREETKGTGLSERVSVDAIYEHLSDEELKALEEMAKKLEQQVVPKSE